MGETVGPRPHAKQRFELPEYDWVTCYGCPMLRVFDWHYFYCRELGDKSFPDEWNRGWHRLYRTTWEERAPCGLVEVNEEEV